MKILVCVKQVADAEGIFTVSDDGTRIAYGDNPGWRMNRYDEFAVEEALRIREQIPGVLVDIVSVGPQRVDRTIRRALEMGADEGIHILTGEDAFIDPWEIARLIASHAEKRNYDLILCGVMSEDQMNAQTGQMIAALLSFPCATAVLLERLDPAEGAVYAEREIDSSTREAVTLALPALITVQSGINRPRYPALSAVLRARTQEMVVIREIEPREKMRNTWILDYEYPAPSRRGVILSGTVAQKAAELKALLHNQSLL